jgi:hypothetical protein
MWCPVIEDPLVLAVELGVGGFDRVEGGMLELGRRSPSYF